MLSITTLKPFLSRNLSTKCKQVENKRNMTKYSNEMSVGKILNTDSNNLIFPKRTCYGTFYWSPLMYATEKIMKDHHWSFTMVSAINGKWIDVILDEDNAQFITSEFFDSFENELVKLNPYILSTGILNNEREDVKLIIKNKRIYDRLKPCLDKQNKPIPLTSKTSNDNNNNNALFDEFWY